MADTMINAGGGLSKSKLALATATAADVKSGKKFYAGDKTLKTGTWVPVFVQLDKKYITVNANPRITLTVSGYSEYYCTHSRCGGSDDSSLVWSASEGTFQSSNTWIGNGAFRKLTGCNPTHSVTITSVFYHDSSRAEYMSIWAIK